MSSKDLYKPANRIIGHDKNVWYANYKLLLLLLLPLSLLLLLLLLRKKALEIGGMIHYG